MKYIKSIAADWAALGKVIAVAAALGMGAAVSAENPTFSTLPPEGAIDPNYYPDGIISVELLTDGSINRSSDGFVTLYRDGKELRRIPATNVPMFYCIDGFERAAYGNIHVDFWTSTIGRPGNEPGLYTVTFDPGVVLFSLSKQPNEAFSLDFEITDNGMTFDPPADSTLESITEINITFPKGATVTYQGGDTGITIENIRAATGTVHPDVTTFRNLVNLTFSPALSEEGVYLFDILEDAFTWTIGETEYKNPEYHSSYTVLHTGDLPHISPEPGEYTKLTGFERNGEPSSSFFKIDMPEGVTLNFTSAGSAYLYPIKADGTLDTTNKSYRFAAVQDKADNTCVYLNSVVAQTTITPLPGEYMLSVAEYSYRMSNGTFNKAMQFGPYVFVADEADANYTVTPDNSTPLYELNMITIEFPEGSELSWTGSSYGWLSDGITEYAIYPGISGNKLTFAVSPQVITPGEWTLNIAQTALAVDGDATPVRVNYTIVPDLIGVSEITVSQSATDIYNLQGIRLSTPADALPAGIYIINGKKVRK